MPPSPPSSSFTIHLPHSHCVCPPASHGNKLLLLLLFSICVPRLLNNIDFHTMSRYLIIVSNPPPSSPPHSAQLVYITFLQIVFCIQLASRSLFSQREKGNGKGKCDMKLKFYAHFALSIADSASDSVLTLTIIVIINYNILTSISRGKCASCRAVNPSVGDKVTRTLSLSFSLSLSVLSLSACSQTAMTPRTGSVASQLRCLCLCLCLCLNLYLYLLAVFKQVAREIRIIYLMEKLNSCWNSFEFLVLEKNQCNN